MERGIIRALGLDDTTDSNERVPIKKNMRWDIDKVNIRTPIERFAIELNMPQWLANVFIGSSEEETKEYTNGFKQWLTGYVGKVASND